MRGSLKRDDPKVNAASHPNTSSQQLLLGSYLTAHASGASPSLGELPLRMHVRLCAMSPSRRVLVAVEL